MVIVSPQWPQSLASPPKRWRIIDLAQSDEVIIIDTTIFTAKFTEILRRLRPDFDISEVKPLQVTYTTPDNPNNKRVFFLNNIYRNYSEGDSLDEIVAKFVKAVHTNFQESANFDIHDVVPVIKDEGYISEVIATSREQYGDDNFMTPAYFPFCEGLVRLYAIDTPESMRYMDKDEVDSLGVSDDELFELAVGNLLAKLPEIELHSGPNSYMLTAGGDYEASLLVDQDIWAQIAPMVDGDIVVAIPARDVLLITGSNNEEGLTIISEQAKEIVTDASYHLTDELFQRKGDKWFNRTRSLNEH